MVKYKFVIKTGDQDKAGTDSNIFLKLHGDNISEEVRINGFITGNAFERNKKDEFEIDFIDEDFADIHTVGLRSDCSHSASDWLLASIRINKMDDYGKEGKNTSVFQIDDWIKDKEKHLFTATSGYNKIIPSPTLNYKEEKGGIHYIPADLDYDVDMNFTINCTVDYKTVKTFKIDTQVAVSIPIDIIKFDMQTHIESSIQEDIGENFNTTKTYNTCSKVSSSPNERRLQEVWIVEEYNYIVTMGEKQYYFSVPSAKRFAGFKDLDSGEEVHSIEIKKPELI